MDPVVIDNSSSCSCNKFTKLISIISFVLGIIGIGLAAWMFVSIDNNFGDIDVDFTSLTKDIEELALAIGDSPKVMARSNHLLRTLSVTEPSGLYKHIDESSDKIEGVINNIAETIGGSDEIKGAINDIAELIGSSEDTKPRGLYKLIDDHSDEIESVVTDIALAIGSSEDTKPRGLYKHIDDSSDKIEGAINGIANTIGSSEDGKSSGLYKLIDEINSNIRSINSNTGPIGNNAKEFINVIEEEKYEKIGLSPLIIPVNSGILDDNYNPITTKYNLLCSDMLCVIMQNDATIKAITKDGEEVVISLSWSEYRGLKASVDGNLEVDAMITVVSGIKICIIIDEASYTITSNTIGLQNSAKLSIVYGENEGILGGLAIYSESLNIIILDRLITTSGSPFQYYTYILPVSTFEKQAYHKVANYLTA